jgi:hypothetical protein
MTNGGIQPAAHDIPGKAAHQPDRLVRGKIPTQDPSGRPSRQEIRDDRQVSVGGQLIGNVLGPLGGTDALVDENDHGGRIVPVGIHDPRRHPISSARLERDPLGMTRRCLEAKPGVLRIGGMGVRLKSLQGAPGQQEGGDPQDHSPKGWRGTFQDGKDLESMHRRLRFREVGSSLPAGIRLLPHKASWPVSATWGVFIGPPMSRFRG